MGWGLGYPKMRVFGLTESHSLCLLKIDFHKELNVIVMQDTLFSLLYRNVTLGFTQPIVLIRHKRKGGRVKL